MPRSLLIWSRTGAGQIGEREFDADTANHDPSSEGAAFCGLA
jgi:hypothetical protein